MDSRTRRIFPSVAMALMAGAALDDLVTGPEPALRRVRRKMRVRREAKDAGAKRDARRRMQKASRRGNRS